MIKARVEIHLKRGVADPEGANILKALKLLGFGKAVEVRSAKLFEIVLDESSVEDAREQVEEMCSRLLANPVIHDHKIDFE